MRQPSGPGGSRRIARSQTRRDNALFVEKAVQREEDGDILFAREQSVGEKVCGRRFEDKRGF